MSELSTDEWVHRWTWDGCACGYPFSELDSLSESIERYAAHVLDARPAVDVEEIARVLADNGPQPGVVYPSDIDAAQAVVAYLAGEGRG